MAKIEMEFPSLPNAKLLYGTKESNLRFLENELNIDISADGNILRITGPTEDVSAAQKILIALYEEAKTNRDITAADFAEQLARLRGGGENAISAGCVLMTNDKRPIRAKTENQKLYVEAIRRDDVVFGVGPAGTGKTYLAMAMAVDALLRKRVKRIVLVRPAVEAGEKLGFLPGDMAEKVNPYLRPLYDALYDMVEVDRAQHWISQGTIEVAPLAFMRGRTLNSSFIILDEAQNTTQEQMKMFLTRLGFGSKAIITGDLTQTDLIGDVRSGLTQAIEILNHVEGISIVELTDKDIVRHPLVQRIVIAYDHASK